MRGRRRLAWTFVGAVPLALLYACLPGDGPGGRLDGTDIDPGIDFGDGGAPRADVDLGDPFALDGLTPSHGPFTGGTRTRLSGRGFTSRLQVFIGDVAPTEIVASDPTRAAVVTPPGRPGFVDVRIRDEATAEERVLPNGFFYDAFVVTPDTGATSGGTRIALEGSGTSWTSGTKIAIGGAPCTDVTVVSPTRLECVTPASTPGAKDVAVEVPGEVPTQAREAFTYSDSPDGYRGGLSGGALAGRVRVLAFNAETGAPLAGAYVVAGPSVTEGIVKTTAATGVAEITGVTGTKVTITIAAKCHQPVTYVDVPVDTVTAYLPFVLEPACIEDPGSGGGFGGGRYGGLVEGQLLFPGGAEFKRAGWSTVPAPVRPTERRAAYVFSATRSATEPFQLPPASAAITPDAPGGEGYSFSHVVLPGNATLYVVAGIEDRSESPPRFFPYAMGVARGISVPVQARVTGVDVVMDVLFDHRVSIAANAPAPGPRGPDRLRATGAVTLGAAGFALVPRGSVTTMLPAPGTVDLVGMPSLDKALAGEQYVLGAVAATGTDLQRPASVVSGVRTNDANAPVSLGGFLGVPVLVQPSAGTWSGTHVEYGGAAGTADLSVTQVVSGEGLVTWTIVAPAGARSFEVPDLTALPGTDRLGLVRGAIRTTTYVARIEEFSYGRLRSGQLGVGAWSAYAVDSLSGVY